MALSLSEVQRALPDRYLLEREVGRGGMATVYLAVDEKHDRRVAIKVLHPELSRAVGKERFLREIGTAAKLSHAHILALHDSGESEGLFYYVMPFVDGDSLRKRLDREKQLSIRDARKIATEIADALAYAHEQGVIHRDVKPENILFRAGHAVLADFGIAHVLAEPGMTEPTLTIPGRSPGTPAYMSPEQAAGGGPLDGRSDQYSLACVLYEVLSGGPVFSGNSTQEVVGKHLTDRPVPLQIVRPVVPKSVSQALQQALAKAPYDRFPSMADFSAAMEDVSLSGEPPARPDTKGPLVSVRPWTLLVLLVVGAAVAFGLIQTVRGMGESSPGWEDTWPGSIVVLPFSTPGSSEEETDLSREIAERTARELDWWDEIQARGSGSMAGIITDLGIDEGSFRSSRDGVEVARAAGAQALLGITARIRGDSAFVQATLHDVPTGSLVERSLSSEGHSLDLAALVSPIALGLLRFEEDTPPPRQKGATSLPAFRAFVEGRRAFFSSDLLAAEEAFGRSVELDLTFGIAHSWLALAKYWRGVTGEVPLSRVRADISRHSILSMDHSGGLTDSDSLHVQAFFSFQRGDYDQARELYREILVRDPQDLGAWLMAGEVEFQDPWMVSDGAGEASPRGDWNFAWNAYRRTTEQRPTFEIGYGRVFAMAEEIDRGIRIGACPLYPALRPELLSPGVGGGVEGAQAFCPVFLDSILWLPKEVFDSLAGPVLDRGSEEIFDQSVRMLEAWESFAPYSPQPKEFLADAILGRRDRMRLGQPQSLRRDAALALEHVEAAVLLKEDSTPRDLFRIANLQLAAGMVQEAKEMADEAMSLHRTLADSIRASIPLWAANVFLATGQIEIAREIVYSHRSTRYVRDPSSEGMISYAGAEPVPYSISVLGAGGVLGEPVRRELASMDSIWGAAGYTGPQVAVLRNTSTIRMATGLVQDSSVLSEWGQVVDLDRHLWDALALPPRDVIANAEYEASLEEALQRNDRAKRTFLIAWKARTLGSPEEAHRIFSRMDSLAYRVDALDSGCGLRVISLLYRAEALEEMGRFQEAEAALTEFLSAWPEPDELAQGSVDRARALIDRITPHLTEAPAG